MHRGPYARVSAADRARIVQCDNAPCHSKVEELEDDFPGSIVRRLGPYSPNAEPKYLVENEEPRKATHETVFVPK